MPRRLTKNKGVTAADAGGKGIEHPQSPLPSLEILPPLFSLHPFVRQISRVGCLMIWTGTGRGEHEFYLQEHALRRPGTRFRTSLSFFQRISSHSCFFYDPAQSK